MSVTTAPRCGIYAIVHIASGQYYIGSSVRIHQRWSEHRRLLRRGLHHSALMQQAWRDFGRDAFDFRILEECGRDELAVKEQDYIDAFQPVFNGYAIVTARSEDLYARLSERGKARSAIVTHCPAGHPYDAANTGYNQGKRICRACAAARATARITIETPEQREKRRAAVKASYEQHKAERQAKNREYAAVRKEEKREYDRSRRELINARGIDKRANETPEQRAARLAAKHADYQKHRAERLAHMNEAYRAKHPVPEPATACKNGHPYTDGSFRIWRGKKLCKPCRAITKRAYRERVKHA